MPSRRCPQTLLDLLAHLAGSAAKVASLRQVHFVSTCLGCLHNRSLPSPAQPLLTQLTIMSDLMPQLFWCEGQYHAVW